MKKSLLLTSLLFSQSIFCADAIQKLERYKEKFFNSIDTALVNNNQEIIEGLINTGALSTDEILSENSELNLPACPPLMRGILLSADNGVAALINKHANVNTTTKDPLPPVGKQSLTEGKQDITKKLEGPLSPFAVALYVHKMYLKSTLELAGQDDDSDDDDKKVDDEDIDILTRQKRIIRILKNNRKRDRNDKSSLEALKLDADLFYNDKEEE